MILGSLVCADTESHINISVWDCLVFTLSHKVYAGLICSQFKGNTHQECRMYISITDRFMSFHNGHNAVRKNDFTYRWAQWIFYSPLPPVIVFLYKWDSTCQYTQSELLWDVWIVSEIPLHSSCKISDWWVVSNPALNIHTHFTVYINGHFSSQPVRADSHLPRAGVCSEVSLKGSFSLQLSPCIKEYTVAEYLLYRYNCLDIFSNLDLRLLLSKTF